MIIQEPYGDKFVWTYSDLNLQIQKVGTDEIYNEAIDLAPCRYEYVETNKPIDDEAKEASY